MVVVLLDAAIVGTPPLFRNKFRKTLTPVNVAGVKRWFAVARKQRSITVVNAEWARPRSQPLRAGCSGAQDSLPRIVVLGIGNILLRDDGVGVRVMEQLRGEPRSPAPVFIDGGTLSFSLLELIAAADAMLVADAAELGERPGTVRLFEDESMDRFLSGARHRSVHEVSLSDVLDMARLSDCLPGRRALLSIQPMTIDWGEVLSPELSASFDAACAEARELLGRWGSAP